MDWDDDELATQIYDKPGEVYPGPGGSPSGPGQQQHAPMLSAPTAAPRQSGAGAPSPFGGAPSPGPASGPPPSRPGLPSPFDDLPEGSGAPASQPPAREPTEVTRQPKGEKGGSMGMIIGIGVVVLLALAAGAWYMLRPPEPGTVHLSTDPADATVLFDDQQVQATSSPFVLANVEPGAHLIEVRKTGYQSWSTQIDLRPGQTLTLPPVSLRPEAGGGEASEGTGFALTSDPAGAKVFVDGRELDGETPLRVEDLPAGSHTVRVEADGRRAWQRQIQLADGQIMELEAELEGATVSVRFESSPRGAEVVLVRGDDREEIGTTPVREDVDLSGGAWTIEMSRNGYETWTEELEVPDGEDRFTVEAELDREARVATHTMRRRTTSGGGGGGGGGGSTMTMAASGAPGTLRVNTRPWSQVYVDGRLIGNTPQMNISVPAGSHRLTLVNPDFNIRHNVTVNVGAGQTVTKVINLPTN
ncbi:MAG: PEGA domain-containing protein [Gammaproteobacteria bacterium]|nr:PEGA domain-containing protein [Gemmatimonadota bacterium]NIR39632.1 PEGA domain-containing protein [Actinomycetota bacterium]NIU77789.1 PEGA domain-containing protein [Gammaproteobacteria bacterium]